jgi:hypothetical protein
MVWCTCQHFGFNFKRYNDICTDKPYVVTDEITCNPSGEPVQPIPAVRLLVPNSLS